MENNFKKERDRLGISQEKIAEVCDVTRQAIYRWEKGSSIPFDKLAKLVSLGFDIQFIVTGVPSSNLNQVQDRPMPAEDSLDARVSKFNETQQDIIKMMVREMEQAAEREKLAKDLARQAMENGKKP